MTKRRCSSAATPALLVALLVLSAATAARAAPSLPPELGLGFGSSDEMDLAAAGRRVGDSGDADCISRMFRAHVPVRTIEKGGGCASLSANDKGWFAVALVACKLELMGRPVLPAACAAHAGSGAGAASRSAEALRECGRGMDPEQHQTHTAFLNHVDSVCFYTEARFWRAEQEAVMLKLETTSNATSFKLESISAAASSISAQQEGALASAAELGARLEHQQGVFSSFCTLLRGTWQRRTLITLSHTNLIPPLKTR